MKRFISMLLAGLLCVGMLVSVTGCSKTDNTPVVATIDGEDIHSSELAAYIVYNMMYAKYDCKQTDSIFHSYLSITR